MTICNKCTYLWRSGTKWYCNSPYNVKFSKNKKECKSFKKGENAKKFMKKGGRNTTWNPKRK